jgi:hypothetical protein
MARKSAALGQKSMKLADHNLQDMIKSIKQRMENTPKPHVK